jgi:hypothetical protein
MYDSAFNLYGKKCEVCGGTWKLVVHHFIPRSRCKILTYEPLNWVILCAKCHFALEVQKEEKIKIAIIIKRGMKWLKKLNKLYEKKKKLTGYYGVDWLKKEIKKLQRLLMKINESIFKSLS